MYENTIWQILVGDVKCVKKYIVLYALLRFNSIMCLVYTTQLWFLEASIRNNSNNKKLKTETYKGFGFFVFAFLYIE